MGAKFVTLAPSLEVTPATFTLALFVVLAIVLVRINAKR